MKNKQTSIIIVSLNEKEDVLRLLNSIKRQGIEKNAEIILADNHSTDGTVEAVKKNYPFVKVVISDKNIGLNIFNKALKECSCDYILTMGSDMDFEKNCLEILLKTLKENKDIGCVAPLLRDFEKRDLIDNGGCWASRAFYVGILKKMPRETIIEIPYRGVSLISKKTISELGYLYDPSYFIYAEDFDLGLRLRLLGFKTVLARDAVLYHKGSQSKKYFSEEHLTYLMERNLLMTYIKICSPSNLILFSPYVLLMRIVAMFKDLAKLKFGKIISRIKAMLWVLININSVLEKRRFVQKRRKVPDAKIFKIFTEKHLFGL